MWERLYRLKREGVTQIITTHYMDEAEQLCDRLVVMDGGLIVAEGSPAELIDRYSTKEVLELRFAPERAAGGRARWSGWRSGWRSCRTGCCSTPPTASTSQAELATAGFRPLSALVRRSSLEDVFLRLTGRTLVD